MRKAVGLVLAVLLAYIAAVNAAGMVTHSDGGIVTAAEGAITENVGLSTEVEVRIERKRWSPRTFLWDTNHAADQALTYVVPLRINGFYLGYIHKAIFSSLGLAAIGLWLRKKGGGTGK